MSTARAAGLAAIVSVALHGVAFSLARGPEPLAVAGGGSTATARLGNSFEDMIRSSAVSRPEVEAAEVPTPVALPLAQPPVTPTPARPTPTPAAPSAQPERPPLQALKPVTAPLPAASALPAAAVATTPALTAPVPPAAPAATRPTVPSPTVPATAPPTAAEPPPAAAPTPEAQAATPPEPETLTAVDPTLAPDRSPRPPERPERPERQKKRAEAAAPAQKKGNQADARRGTTQGQAQGQAASQSTARAGASDGNGAVSSYPGLVMKKLSRTRRDRVSGRGAALVAFTISASGGISDARIVHSSGSPVVDRAGLSLVRRAAPFPAPPKGAKRSFTFEFTGS